MRQAATPYILAIDHGTSGVKAALISMEGELADFESAPTPVYFLPGGGAEQNPDEWWRALVTATRGLLRRKRVPVKNIAAIGVSSTFSSTVAVGADGRALMNSLTWMDSRGAPYVKRLISGFPEVEGYNIFRLSRWIRSTGGGPQLSGKDDIAHMLLVKHEYPSIYEKARMFLGSKDYLNLRLTGEFAASFDSIMLFWVTDTRDINNIRYDDALIRKLGIDRNMLPRLVNATDVIGTLRPAAAHELGLPAGIKVVCGSPDHQSALVGSGAVRDFEGHLYIGTSSWVECIVPFKKTDILHSIASIPSAIPGKYQCINEQDIAGGCLSFLVDNVFCRKNSLRPGPAPKEPYRLLDGIASAVPPGSNGVIFTPWLNGERSPVDSTTIRGGFHNLSMTSTAEDMVRAVFEGVANNTRWNLEYVEKFIGRRFDSLNFIGGGAKSKVWCRIFADVMDRSIRQVKDPIQANARGAAFIAAVGLGHIGFDDIPSLIKYQEEFRPGKENRARYDALYKEFLNIYKNNRAMYGRLNRKQGS